MTDDDEIKAEHLAIVRQVDQHIAACLTGAAHFRSLDGSWLQRQLRPPHALVGRFVHLDAAEAGRSEIVHVKVEFYL